MMNSELFRCLREERSIFRDFSSYKDLGRFQAFSSPGLSEIAHWNLVYPLEQEQLTPSSEELSLIKLYFQNQNVAGNLLNIDSTSKQNATEESEYFLLDTPPVIERMSLTNEMTHTETELDQFCNLIQISFSLADSTIEYFKKKMIILSSRKGTKFYVIKLYNEIVGGCSTFKTESNATFMFNVATHPDMQRKGLAKDIIAYAAERSENPLYTYSHNSIMRQMILPSLGFVSIGTIWCQPLPNIGRK